MRHAITFPQILAAGLLLSIAAYANAEEDSLAQQSQNPLAALSTVLFEYNYEEGGKDEDFGDHVLNVKPVYPIALDDGTLIARAVVPLLSLDKRESGQGDKDGLGDVNLQAYYVPASNGGDFTWGMGPTLTLPSHSDDRLGRDRWSLGPAAALIYTPGNWLLGALIQNQWGLAGDDDDPDVNQFLLQYFINYNFDNGWYLTSTPVMTADWEADNSDQRYRIPVGGGIGRVVRWGDQAIDLKLQGFRFVESADSAPDWSIQFQFKLLFPKG